MLEYHSVALSNAVGGSGSGNSLEMQRNAMKRDGDNVFSGYQDDLAFLPPQVGPSFNLISRIEKFISKAQNHKNWPSLIIGPPASAEERAVSVLPDPLKDVGSGDFQTNDTTFDYIARATDFLRNVNGTNYACTKLVCYIMFYSMVDGRNPPSDPSVYTFGQFEQLPSPVEYLPYNCTYLFCRILFWSDNVQDNTPKCLIYEAEGNEFGEGAGTFSTQYKCYDWSPSSPMFGSTPTFKKLSIIFLCQNELPGINTFLGPPCCCDR